MTSEYSMQKPADSRCNYTGFTRQKQKTYLTPLPACRSCSTHAYQALSKWNGTNKKVWIASIIRIWEVRTLLWEWNFTYFNHPKALMKSAAARICAQLRAMGTTLAKIKQLESGSGEPNVQSFGILLWKYLLGVSGSTTFRVHPEWYSLSWNVEMLVGTMKSTSF